MTRVGGNILTNFSIHQCVHLNHVNEHKSTTRITQMREMKIHIMSKLDVNQI